MTENQEMFQILDALIRRDPSIGKMKMTDFAVRLHDHSVKLQAFIDGKTGIRPQEPFEGLNAILDALHKKRKGS